MTAKKGTANTSNVVLQGKTLADIDKDKDRKGPQEPGGSGKDYGACKGALTLAIGAKEFDFKTDPNATPTKVTAKLKGGTITLATQTIMPKLASQKDLSPDALKEWNRFVAKLQVHEDGHADSFFDLAQDIAKELDAETADGTGKDEKTAQVVAQKALLALITKDYGGSKLSDRITANAKAYDAKTNHGASQGAVLNTTIN